MRVQAPVGSRSSGSQYQPTARLPRGRADQRAAPRARRPESPESAARDIPRKECPCRLFVIMPKQESPQRVWLESLVRVKRIKDGFVKDGLVSPKRETFKMVGHITVQIGSSLNRPKFAPRVSVARFPLFFGGART